MTARIAINGFGRIGRLAFRIMWGNPAFEIVALNDLTDAKTLAHLLKYDTSQGRFDGHTVSFEGDDLIVDGKTVRVLKEKDPS